MGTFNGVGTGLRRWKHHDDGTSTATLWFLLVYVPVLPLRRYRVRVLTDFEKEQSLRPSDVAVALLGGAVTWTEPVETLERLPFSWREAAETYLRAYVLVPLLLLWPFLVANACKALWREHLGDPLASLPTPVEVGIGIVAFLNVFTVLLVAARRMRGYPGSRRAT